MRSLSTLTGRKIAEADLVPWSRLQAGCSPQMGDFATGLRLIARIGAAAEAANHHPDLDVRYIYLDLRLSSHDVGGVTTRDVVLARAMSATAAADGLRRRTELPHVQQCHPPERHDGSEVRSARLLELQTRQDVVT